MKERFKKYLAECLGTLILVVVGCGVAVGVGCGDTGGIVATALAFGIAIVILAYTIGKVSGGHVNPAVSLAVFLNGGMDWIDLIGYIASQILGAIVGSALLGLFFGGYQATGANDIGSLVLLWDNSEAMGIVSALVVEVVLTFFFVLAILGITSKKEDSSVGGLLIGVVLTGIHLLGIPLTGTSVNPARSLSAAIFAAFGGETSPLQHVWIFLLAPLAGGALAALVWKFLLNKKKEEKAE